MADKGRKGNTERTVVKGLCFIGVGTDSNTIEADVKDGKLVRIKPLHYDRKYKPEEFKPWRMEARGKAFAVPLKSI